jgi:formylglycine-generating enzyme required for sulfatase activity
VRMITGVGALTALLAAGIGGVLALFRADTFFLPGDSNASWMPVIREFEGVEMALVPAGCFVMGSDAGEIDESPLHRVCFDEPFWMDRYEVTNAQFAAFEGQAAEASYEKDDNRPRENVTWPEASTFCERRESRLPTEAEWEYAARGSEGWVYPWGDRFVADHSVYGRNSGNQTAGVGSKPGGASWVGVLDLSGNVWEWVADWYDGTYYAALADAVVNPAGPSSGNARVLRGGSYFDVDYGFGYDFLLRESFRTWSSPVSRLSSLGFRCARSAGD